jgi:glutamate transport system substrate-binding protein
MKRLLAVLALAAVAAAGCGGDDDEGSQPAEKTSAPKQDFPAGSTMKRLQDKGEIVIGFKYDVPPFGFKNPQSGAIEGFDVDLGKAVAEKLGVKLKPVEAISDNRIPFLKRGTVDLILSTMTINEERNQEIDFSAPYYIAHAKILVKKDSGLKGIEDLANKKVCTALGSTNAEITKREQPKADLKLVDSYSECFEQIQNGSIDAISTDDVILTGMLIQDDSLEIVGEDLSTEPYGAGIKEGDKQLQDFVSDVIAEYKSDGRWAKAYEKWLGRYTGRKQDPPTMTLEEALAAKF